MLSIGVLRCNYDLLTTDCAPGAGKDASEPRSSTANFFHCFVIPWRFGHASARACIARLALVLHTTGFLLSDQRAASNNNISAQIAQGQLNRRRAIHVVTLAFLAATLTFKFAANHQAMCGVLVCVFALKAQANSSMMPSQVPSTTTDLLGPLTWKSGSMPGGNCV
jgi:hypothetical protein